MQLTATTITLLNNLAPIWVGFVFNFQVFSVAIIISVLFRLYFVLGIFTYITSILFSQLWSKKVDL